MVILIDLKVLYLLPSQEKDEVDVSFGVLIYGVYAIILWHYADAFGSPASRHHELSEYR